MRNRTLTNPTVIAGTSQSRLTLEKLLEVCGYVLVLADKDEFYWNQSIDDRDNNDKSTSQLKAIHKLNSSQTKIVRIKEK